MEYHEHNVDNVAIEVAGQNWSSEVDLSYPGGLAGRAGGIKLPLVGGPFVPRNEGCVQGELRVSRFPSLLVFGVLKPFSRRGRAVATKERDVVREMKEKERERRALLRYFGWAVSFEILMLEVERLWNKRVPFFCATFWLW